MAQLNFTAWLRDQAPNKPLRAEGTTVGDALAAAFTQMPHVRGYVLDDHGWLRGMSAYSPTVIGSRAKSL